MAWAKLDDRILDHPKVLAVGAHGFALYIASIVFSARNLTNGFIPTGKVALLLRFDCSEDVKSLADALVAAGLWEVSRNGYKVHDYLHYNPPKEVVLAKRRNGHDRCSGSGSSSGSSVSSESVSSVGISPGIPGIAFRMPRNRT